MIAVFTFHSGAVLTVDGQNMNGFEDAADIVRYAATAENVIERAQPCRDATT